MQVANFQVMETSLSLLLEDTTPLSSTQEVEAERYLQMEITSPVRKGHLWILPPVNIDSILKWLDVLISSSTYRNKGLSGTA